MNVLLQVVGLHKAFGGLNVVEHLDFVVPDEARVALIGPNGAGKTTVFNLLCGVYPLNAGQVVLDGEDITALPSRRRIARGLARSFQNIRLMPHLSVTENVMLGQHARSGSVRGLLTLLRGSADKREAEARLAEFGLAAHRGARVSDLPYGVRKKIEIVRALMARPKLLLLDEPAAGLNTHETTELTEFLHGVSDSGVTLLVIEHDMSLVRRLCPHTLVLNFGRKIYDGPTAQVHEDPAVLEAYLGPRGVPA
jgi:branched-chain amino acid transport system ATP-binding protein